MFLNMVGITWIGRVTSAGVQIIQTDISNDANALIHVQNRGNHAITRKSARKKTIDKRQSKPT